MTELRRRMIEDMRLHGLLPSTQPSYTAAVRNRAKHYRRSPEHISEQEIRDFFVHRMERRRLAASTIRVHLFAIKFLYGKTLGRPWPVRQLIRVKRTKRWPVVLSPEEVRHAWRRIRRPEAQMSSTLM